MRKYIKYRELTANFDKLPDNSWEKKSKNWFNSSLEKNFNTSINELNSNFSKQITAIMFLSWLNNMNKKSKKDNTCTTIQIAQITGQSQANVAVLSHRLKINNLLEVINNPNLKHRHGKTRKLIIVLWQQLTELSKASYYAIKTMRHLSKLTSLLKTAYENNKPSTDYGGLIEIGSESDNQYFTKGF